MVVKEWLHDSAPEPHLPESTIGYWNFTKHRLVHARRMGNKKDMDTLVSELDPDADNRDDNGKVLSADDAVRAFTESFVGFFF